MMVNVFAAFVLLALAVTARPLTQPAAVLSPGDQRYELSLDTAQSAFQSQIGKHTSCFGSSCNNDEVPVHFPSGKQQRNAPEGFEAIQAIVSIDDMPMNQADEKTLHDPLTGYNYKPAGGLNNLDDVTTSLASVAVALPVDVPKPEDELMNQSPKISVTGSSRTFILALSFLAAFVVLGAALTLFYMKRFVYAYLCTSGLMWDILPRLEKQHLLVDVYAGSTDNHVEEKNLPILDTTIYARDCTAIEGSENPFNQKETGGKMPLSSDGSIVRQDEETYYDAEGTLADFVEVCTAAVATDVTADPDDLPLPIMTPFCTPPPTPPRTPLLCPVQMREVPSAPVTRPAWSLRAADAPVLGMSGSAPMSPLPLPIRKKDAMMAIPGAFTEEEPNRPISIRSSGRRAYRAPVPQLDIAFAMQLRPGLGLGSDPAWLVRFLMAMFGWMTVLWGGKSVQSQRRRALLA